MIRTIRLAAAAVAAAALALAGANASWAAPMPVSAHVAYTASQAGYQNPQTGWRFRFVTGCTYLRTADQDSAVSLGGSLANPSTGRRVSVGVAWNGTGYTAAADLDGTVSTPFSADLVISAHDTICQSVYYNTTSRWLTFTENDVTSGVQRTWATRIGFALWYSAGFGAQDAATLGSASPGTLLAAFTQVSETSYNGTRSTLGGRFTAQPVVATQDGSPPSAGNVVTMTPGPLGTGFTVTVGAA